MKLAMALVCLVLGSGPVLAQGMGLLDVRSYHAPVPQAPVSSRLVQPGYVAIHGACSLGREAVIGGYARYRSPKPIPSLGRHVETVVLISTHRSDNEYWIDVRADNWAQGHLVPLEEVRLLFTMRNGSASFTVTTDAKHPQLRRDYRELTGVRRINLNPEAQTAETIWFTGEVLDPGWFLMTSLSASAYQIDLGMLFADEVCRVPPPPLGPATRR